MKTRRFSPTGKAEVADWFSLWKKTEKESKCRNELQRKWGKLLYKNSDQVFLETNFF